MSKKKASKKAANAARRAEEKRTARIRLLIAGAAVLLLIAAVVAVGISLSRSDSEPSAPHALEIANVENTFTVLKQSGAVVGTYVYSQNDLEAKTEELLNAGVTVELKSGCYAVGGSEEAYAYECASAEQAQALYAYYAANLISGYKPRLDGNIVICGTEALLNKIVLMTALR